MHRLDLEHHHHAQQTHREIPAKLPCARPVLSLHFCFALAERGFIIELMPLKKWLSLFGLRPTGKSCFPLVKDTLAKDKGKFSIKIPDQIIEKNILTMDSTLVGRFIGARPNIDDVRSFVHKKWSLKVQVDVSTMAKGCLSFCFS